MSVHILPEHLEEMEVGTLNAIHFMVRPVVDERVVGLIIDSQSKQVVVLELLPVDFDFFPVRKLDDWAIDTDSICDLVTKASVREKIRSKYLPTLPYQDCRWFGLMSEKEGNLNVYVVAGHIDIAENAAKNMFK